MEYYITGMCYVGIPDKKKVWGSVSHEKYEQMKKYAADPKFADKMKLHRWIRMAKSELQEHIDNGGFVGMPLMSEHIPEQLGVVTKAWLGGPDGLTVMYNARVSEEGRQYIMEDSDGSSLTFDRLSNGSIKLKEISITDDPVFAGGIQLESSAPIDGVESGLMSYCSNGRVKFGEITKKYQKPKEETKSNDKNYIPGLSCGNQQKVKQQVSTSEFMNTEDNKSGEKMDMSPDDMATPPSKENEPAITTPPAKNEDKMEDEKSKDENHKDKEIKNLRERLAALEKKNKKSNVPKVLEHLTEEQRMKYMANKYQEDMENVKKSAVENFKLLDDLWEGRDDEYKKKKKEEYFGFMAYEKLGWGEKKPEYDHMKDTLNSLQRTAKRRRDESMKTSDANIRPEEKRKKVSQNPQNQNQRGSNQPTNQQQSPVQSRPTVPTANEVTSHWSKWFNDNWSEESSLENVNKHNENYQAERMGMEPKHRDVYGKPLDITQQIKQASIREGLVMAHSKTRNNKDRRHGLFMQRNPNCKDRHSTQFTPQQSGYVKDCMSTLIVEMGKRNLYKDEEDLLSGDNDRWLRRNGRFDRQVYQRKNVKLPNGKKQDQFFMPDQEFNDFDFGNVRPAKYNPNDTMLY